MFKSPLFKAATLLGASALIAASPAADVNQDGEVTLAEFMAAADARFAEADTDFNGELSQEERKALRSAKSDERAKKRFAKADANGDGVVSEDEMLAAKEARTEKMKARRAAMRQKIKDRLDTDGDGEISDAEREAAKAERAARRAERGDKPRRSGKKRDRAQALKADTDGDGVVSRAEYQTATEALFMRLDANGDGVLTRGEGRKHNKKKKRRKLR